MKEWLAKHKKWIVAALLLLGVVGEYATGTLGVEEAILKGLGIVQSTQTAPEVPAPATLKGQ